MNYQPQGTYHDHSNGSEKSKPLRQIPFCPKLCSDVYRTRSNLLRPSWSIITPLSR
ncbi:unnamed protein product [Penicillium camemberti]|uniref:Str. FM013 n=1 Tax=Penicillium camemberti (strain FM 013) TaxID=1429867 RepID=A0A0G4PUG5_PENC3|nr:unnamed protein product [Penicillium camemberti]